MPCSIRLNPSWMCNSIIAIVLIWNVGEIKSAKAKGGLFNKPHIFLTINSNAGVKIELLEETLLDRHLQLNWYNIRPVDKSWIGLFDSKPSSASTKDKSLFNQDLNKATKGSTESPIRINSTVIDNLQKYASTDGCLPYWIGYFDKEQGGKPKLVNCLRINPNWMKQLMKKIGDKPISSLMIPGSHNSAIGKYFEAKDELDIKVKYFYNQEENVYTQLMFGIRHLDLYINYYPERKEQFWVAHDAVDVHPFSEVVKNITNFLNEAKSEVVIMDIHRFPKGFDDPKIHPKFINYIKQLLGKLLYLKSMGKNPTMNQMIGKGKRIILAYNEEKFYVKYDFLFKGVQQAWSGDTKTSPSKLKKFLQKFINKLGCRIGPDLWGAMGELTLDPTVVPKESLRYYAQLINPQVYDWFRSPKWYSRSNIVTADFCLSSNLIEMAIKVNKNMASCP